VALYGGFAGTETRRSQRDWYLNPTVLDGAGGNSSYTAVVVSCEYCANVVDGFTLRDCNAGVGVFSGTATVANNTAFDNGAGVAIEYGMANVTNNIIFGNDDDGVRVESGTATITNNTICGNRTDGVIVYDSGIANLTSNIVSFTDGFGVKAKSGASIRTFSHNDVYGSTDGNYSGYAPPLGQGILSLNPMFVDWPNGDYDLAIGSPCIDAGDDSAASPGEMDHGKRPRTIGAHVDMGANEYGLVYFTFADAAKALAIASGMVALSADDAVRLNVERGVVGVDIADAVRLARKAADLDANP
jgi:hypothetical protein